MNDLRLRVRNAMLGLALGDAISWPAMFHRSVVLPFWTRRIRREIDAASEDNNTLPLAMPFSLNRPAEAFSLAPADDTEWAAFTIKNILRQRGKFDGDLWLSSWQKLAHAENLKASVSVQVALAHLRKSIQPPNSGRYNPHYFDDSAVVRAVPIGAVCVGQAQVAATLAARDAEITNAEDGLWAAQAMAAAISAACNGESLQAVLAYALAQLPPASWIRRIVDEALALCDPSLSALAVVPLLSEAIINREYNYGNVAPETFALTLAIVKQTRGEFETAMMMATTFAKAADSVPAFVGALCGAMTKHDILSSSWRVCLQELRGLCIPALSGVDYIALVEQLADLAQARSVA